MGKNDPKNFAQDGTPQGEDWQSRSAAMYIYAAAPGTCFRKVATAHALSPPSSL